MAPENNRHTDLLIHAACNLCGADDSQIVYRGREKHDEPEVLIDRFASSDPKDLIGNLVQCRRCGFRYLTPRLRDDLILRAYQKHAEPSHVRQVEAREVNFERYIRLIEQYLPVKGRWFDVGAGDGALLGVAKKHGWTVAGCEPNREVAAFAKSRYELEIDVRSFDEFDELDAVEQDHERAFDVVSIWDVLEHLPDPAAALARSRDLLRPGGLLAIEVPDIGRFIARAMGRRWFFLMSAHVHYFDRSTLTRMLEQAGFDVLLVKLHWETLTLTDGLERLQTHYPKAAGGIRRVVKTLRLGGLRVPYVSGKTVALARRIA